MHWNHSRKGSQSWLAIALLTAFCFADSNCVFAQGGGNTGGNADTNTGQGAGQAGGGIGQGGLSPDQVFGEGVQRTGVVGESTAPAVGASAASAAGQQSGLGTGGRAGGLGGFGGGGGLGAAFGNLFGGGNASSGNDSNPPIRTRMRAAVELPPTWQMNRPNATSTATLRLRTATNLQPTSAAAKFQPLGRYDRVNVQIQNRTAILTGEVATEADRRMSHLMMRLEPGVSNVQNRIRLAP